MKREVYDPIRNKHLTWTPLAETSLSARRGLGDQEVQEITLLGSCGDPSDPEYTSHRDGMYSIFERYNISEEQVFNPEVGRWEPMCGPVEAIRTARASVNTTVITNKTHGTAGITDMGFAFYGGMLRGQESFGLIECDDNSPDETRIARKLAKRTLEIAQARGAPFELYEDIDLLTHAAAGALKRRIQRTQHSGRYETQTNLPPHRTDLDPSVYLSGTSGRRKPAWMKEVADILAADDVPVNDSFRTRWDETAMNEEYLEKLDVGVQLIAVTRDQLSYGALAEIGPRALQAHMSGQSLGVYVEPHKSSLTSPTNRTRALVLEHVNRLRDDFPDLPIFVTNSLRRLAQFGIVEYYKHEERYLRR